MVLIEGMDKPKNCWECPLTHRREGILFCDASKGRYADDQIGWHRETPPDWCPMKEVQA